MSSNKDKTLSARFGSEIGPMDPELAKNPVPHNRSKHIDIRFHYIRECIAGGQVVLRHVHTAQQLADLLTKHLGQRRLAQLMVKIGVEELIHGDQARTQGLGEECWCYCCSGITDYVWQLGMPCYEPKDAIGGKCR
ncbi:hypothetical protein BS78_01G251800 [Paspalum vaginatum]|nr:hypothetical protein BS78_01G251800 [Paspalum vaginatum]